MKPNELIIKLSALAATGIAMTLSSCVAPVGVAYPGQPGGAYATGGYAAAGGGEVDDSGADTADDAAADPGWSEATGYGVPAFSGGEAYGAEDPVAVLPAGAVY